MTRNVVERGWIREATDGRDMLALLEDLDLVHPGGEPVAVERHPGRAENRNLAAFALETARLLLGDGAAIEMPSPVMGAEDWSYVLQEVPGAMAFLGTSPKAKGAAGPVAPNHSNRMVLDEDAMAAGIATYAGVALRWLAGASSR